MTRNYRISREMWRRTDVCDALKTKESANDMLMTAQPQTDENTSQQRFSSRKILGKVLAAAGVESDDAKAGNRYLRPGRRWAIAVVGSSGQACLG
jgi:hypothetical protein